MGSGKGGGGGGGGGGDQRMTIFYSSAVHVQVVCTSVCGTGGTQVPGTYMCTYIIHVPVQVHVYIHVHVHGT